MRQADGAPYEQLTETRQRQQPCEEGVALASLVDERETSKSQLQQDTPDRTARFVDVGEKLGCHVLCRESLQCPSAAEGAAICHGKNRDGDDRVEYRRQTLNPSFLNRDDERRVLGI